MSIVSMPRCTASTGSSVVIPLTFSNNGIAKRLMTDATESRYPVTARVKSPIRETTSAFDPTASCPIRIKSASTDCAIAWSYRAITEDVSKARRPPALKSLSSAHDGKTAPSLSSRLMVCTISSSASLSVTISAMLAFQTSGPSSATCI